MNGTEATFNWQRGAIVGLALLSFILPVVSIIPRYAPLAPFGAPASLSDYRLTVAALVLGLACGVGAFIGSRRAAAGGSRWLSVLMASGGMLVSGHLLWSLIGSCGVQVLWAACHP